MRIGKNKKKSNIMQNISISFVVVANVIIMKEIIHSEILSNAQNSVITSIIFRLNKKIEKKG